MLNYRQKNKQGSVISDSRNVVFTIVSQPEPYHASVAKRLKQDIESQVLQLENVRIGLSPHKMQIKSLGLVE